MLTVEQVRQFAMSLPEATEQDHHGMDSFRVRGRIFARDPEVMTLLLASTLRVGLHSSPSEAVDAQAAILTERLPSRLATSKRST